MSLKKKPAGGLNVLRQQAEKALTTTRAQVKKMTPEEVQHLVHELQVHQIELEMQNEELRRTQVDLELARDRFATLYDFTPVGYATLDGGGNILEANLTFCHLLGLSRTDILHKKFEKYLDPDDQPAFYRYLDTLRQKPGTHPSDVLTLRNSDLLHRVRLEGCLEPTEASGIGSLFRIAVEDVTMQERIELAQEEQKALMTMVVGGVMEAIISTDEDERIVLFNEAAETMLRCPASKAIGQTIDQFIPARFRAAHHTHHRQFGEEGVASRPMGVAREIFALRTDGKEFPVEASISKIKLKEKEKKLFTVVLRDITERRQAQEMVKKEQQFASNVLETAGALLVILDPQWQILRMNRLSEEIFQHSIERVHGKPFWNLWASSEKEAQGVRQTVKSYKAGTLPMSFESAVVDKDRQRRWIHWNTTAMYDEEKVVRQFIATGVDVTARKEAEITLQATYQRLERQQRELRSLAAQLLSVQEEERRRISRDLHDDVNQRLALLSLKLQAARDVLPDHHLVTPMIQELYENVANLSDDIRHLAYQYHPSILDDLGLGSALRSLCEDFEKWERISVTCELPDGARKISQAVGTCLYRVAQESLRNVSKHTQASAVHLILREDE
ncbi:MAG TPA: PAS domain S-box protein, partial [Nitrospirales bacterium]|nr:PAS domain S-box protein [Nitrospirales bacterium]